MVPASAAPSMPLASSSAVRRLVLGLLVVVVDLRVQGFDLVVDAVGWIVVVGALGELRHTVPGLRPLRLVAGLAAVLSFADLLHRQVTSTTTEDPLGDGSLTTTTTTTATVAPMGLQGDLASGYSALTVVFLVALCCVLAAAAHQAGHLSAAAHLRVVAVATAVVQGTGVVFAAVLQLTASAATPDLEDGPAVVWLGTALAVGGFLTTVWVLVTLWRLRTWQLLVVPSDTALRG